ncbi:hypothetical protein BKA00_000443 [Actinomadura coerulea]|uniref:Uncharacterized protein n=1 Tax=Actinomadura coerulea TaxID=46159 RepID=A0A7X0KWW2_9ACTN|nr:hypothetical protein [Actinomadura coerulea]MBB6393529.1 hypothetical protein [Actinomadura coerulea]GGP92231.1 hypothetical protein GCM10010187_04580 [Actinomadura coerulea]
MSDPVPFFPAPAPGSSGADADDLAALCDADRRRTRTRTAVAVGFALIGAALTAPVAAQVPPRQATTAVVVALAVVKVIGLFGDAWHWVTRRYELASGTGPGVRRWIVRRWYAPGSLVWYDDFVRGTTPLVVLGWVHDPACHQPWALVYDGTEPDPAAGVWGAYWVPLEELSPRPTEPPALRAPQDLGEAEFGDRLLVRPLGVDRVVALDVTGWRARPADGNTGGHRSGVWVIEAGDYADEGEPDLFIEVTAEFSRDVAEFIVRAVGNEAARSAPASYRSGWMA